MNPRAIADPRITNAPRRGLRVHLTRDADREPIIAGGHTIARALCGRTVPNLNIRRRVCYDERCRDCFMRVRSHEWPANVEPTLPGGST